MILVGQYDSPFVRRVAISLHLLRIPFSRNTISVFADAEAMRRINPLGRIPSLIIEDGEVLIESSAILDHLDEVAGSDRALLPRSGPERRRALRMIALATGAIEKAGAIVYERTLRPPENRYGPWLERCRQQLDGGLAALEAITREGWQLSDRPMQPDITIGCAVGYLHRALSEAISEARHPELERLWTKCEALAAFRETRPSDDETMPERPL